MRKHRLISWLITAFIVAVGAAALVFLPGANRTALYTLETVQSAGPWGPLLMIAVYIIACVLLIPGSILTIGAGFLFGVPLGVVTVSIGSTLGAGAAYLLSRTLLRGFVVQKLAANPRFRALDRAVGQQGFKIVLLTRLSPVLPFNLLNYAFGVTKVSFRDYILASWLGMLPGAFLYVYIGSAAKSLAEVAAGRGQQSMEHAVLFAIGLGATIVFAILLARIARKALREAGVSSQDDPENGYSAGDKHAA